jgi:ferredoxin-type protein NapG
MGVFIAAAGAAAGKAVGIKNKVRGKRLLRPPGSKPEAEFLAKCIRCFQCGEICPNGCIDFHDLDAGLGVAYTPYIHARAQGCTACMKCTQVCPTGALTPIEDDDEVIMATVKMGVARLNKDMCYSWAEPARTCGVCYRACPFPGQAMTIGLWERPTVNKDKCIGCGLCEQSCIHLPQAIAVVPVETA